MLKRSFAAPGKKGAPSPFMGALYWILSFAFALWLIWLTFSRSPKGVVGESVSGALHGLLGQSAYLFPFIFLYGLSAILLKLGKPHKGLLTLTGGILLMLGALSSGLQLMGTAFPAAGFDGGHIGYFMEYALETMFGAPGAGVFSFALFLVGAQLLFKISWGKALKASWSAIAEDYRSWSQARRDLKAKLKLISEKEGPQPKYEAKPIPEASAGDTMRHGVPVPQPAKEERPKIQPPLPVKERERENPDIKVQPHKKPRTYTAHFKDFKLPTADLLDPPARETVIGPSREEMEAARTKLEETFKSFDITVHVADIFPGPVITRYEVTPAPGVKISSIVSLANDVALAMKAAGIRVIAPIPGKSAIGFEIPNQKRAKVGLREVLESPAFNERKEPLAFGIGRHAEGSIALANLEDMPHLLVAGSTGSGKSVFLQSLILSLMFRNTPDEVKFVMIDPKRLELSFYQDVPYLYDPKVLPDSVSVITDAKDAAKTLICLTKVMMQRYKKFEKARVKNIAGYNRWAAANNEQPEHYIVVVIDELADLMVQAKNVVEENIQRLAQMARAVGIHLVLATQQPSVDVITGVIKANLPSRIALQVTSKVNSRVILDTSGAEALIGKGDLLYLTKDSPKPLRIQGAFVSESEINKVVDYLKTQGRPDYPMFVEEDETAGGGKGGSSEELITALKLISERRRVSQDLLKAHFGSSARATNILSILEVNKFIHKPEGSNRWEIFFDKIESHLANHQSAPAQPEGAAAEQEGVK
jgi:S-DNA-T family DNA segregation ATPase FtsK/SpoIIIE